MYDKPTVKFMFNGENLKAFALRSGRRQGCPLSLNIVMEVLATAIIYKEAKGIELGKVEVKLSFVHGMILNIENPKEFTKKLLELINEFSKVEEYKINIQKLVSFLYNRNKLS